MKSGRQGIILRIVSEQIIETQNQLMDELKKHGINATQATLSRDIRELRLVKQHTANGGSRYVAAEAAPAQEMSRRLKENLRQTVTGVYACQNLVIIKTLPGLAPAVCTAIDGIAPLPGLVGSLSGNDTVFLAMRDNAAAEALAGEGRSLFMG